MKSFLVYALLGLTTVESAAVTLKRNNVNQIYHQKRQSDSLKPGEPLCLGPGGKVPDPPDAAPRKIKLKPEVKVAGAESLKMRYGPYSVPNMGTKSISGEPGMLWNCADRIEKPCEECTILRMVAGLEYANGTNANLDTGMWLHHMLMITEGPTRWDPTCVNVEGSVPHFGVGTTSKNSERIFAAGNERTPADLTQFTGPDSMMGYQLNKEDNFRLLVDLMNMNMVDHTVYLTVSYDFLPGPMRAGWMDAKPIWLDIDQCGLSEVHPPKDSGRFTLQSVPWTPNFEGLLAGVGGHVHDGGVNVEIMATNTTQVCNSVAKYGESAEYIYTAVAGTMGDMHFAKQHISSMSNCWVGEMSIQKLEKSQSWVIKGNYDYDRFEGNTEEGKQVDIMVLAIMFVVVPPGGVPRPLVG